MVKQLKDMCLGCIAQNLHVISNVGKHLPTLHKEKILQWVVNHNMLTTEYLSHVTYHLFSPALRSISFVDCDQITDKLLILLDACKCVLESITIDGCKVTDIGVSALLSHQDELQTLVLKNISELTGTGLEVLRSRKSKEVHLSCIQITNESLVAFVTRNPTISRLNIGYCDKLTHEVIPAIAATLAHELEHLTLINIHNIENNDLVVLSQHCKNLEGLVLHVFSCSRITSARLRALSKECTKLKLLDVSFCYSLEKSSSKEFLTELPVSLKKLVLAGLQLEGGDIHTAVSKLPKLVKLRLCGKISITEEDALKLYEMVGPQLICLDIAGYRQIMTDDILRLIVKNCTSLEQIQLGSCMKLTGESLRMLFRDQERSSNLTLLRMSGCKNLYHDILLDMSKSCVNLNELYMAGIKCVDDTLLFSIANHMPHLKNISLGGFGGSAASQVTDNGVVELTRCCPLEDISLAGIQSITDKSIFALANNCPDLKNLVISGCSKVTTQATNYLQDVCNDKVYVSHSLPNADPNLVMAKNVDTGEFCQIDQTKWSTW